MPFWTISSVVGRRWSALLNESCTDVSEYVCEEVCAYFELRALELFLLCNESV